MITAFGAVRSPLAILALPVAVLVGLAFSAPISALAVRAPSDATFNPLFRFAITPMFLFSGIFFPITRMPHALRVVAYLTPLWHGVNLCRNLTLGTAHLWPSLANVGYLLAVGRRRPLPRVPRVPMEARAMTAFAAPRSSARCSSAT